MTCEEMYSINNIEGYGRGVKLIEWLSSFNKIFVYRKGYEITSKGKVKQPSEYKVFKDEDYGYLSFEKISGSGHKELIGKVYDSEYEFFLTKESALEYANGDPLKEWNEENNFRNNQLDKLNTIYKKLSKEEQEFLKDYISGVSYGKYKL